MENKEIESVRTTGTSRRVGIRFVSNLLLGDLSPRIYQAKKKKKKKRESESVCQGYFGEFGRVVGPEGYNKKSEKNNYLNKIDGRIDKLI